MYIYSEDWTEDEIFARAEELVGRSLSEIDKSGWLEKKADKGRIGNMIQSDYFGIPANSIRESDFIHHDIELKVTPILRRQRAGYSSKERLVLGMINYMQDYKIPFEQSIVNRKVKNILLVFYLHEENTPAHEFKIIKTAQLILNSKDHKQVEKDYEAIVDKICEGKAHEISERQQVILGACTKGQGKGRDWVLQPFSEEKAKSRAYSYKVGYMSAYFRSIMTPEEIEHLFIPEQKTFIEVVEETLNKYIGKTAEEIHHETSYNKSNKSYSYLFNLMSAMFDTGGSNINQTNEFIKEGYSLKTVTKRMHKKDNQDMSFPNIDFMEIYNDDFENSSWDSYFSETTYILGVWKEYENKKYVFERYVYWNPDTKFMQQSEKLYNHIKYMLENNEVEVYNLNKTKHEAWKDNLPKKGEFTPFQIRPKGSGESVIITLPTGQLIKKKSIMIDKEYIRNIISE